MNQTILVVEDDPELLDLLRELLQLKNYTVLSAVSGADAMKVWEKNFEQIDLVLTDLTLPDGMTGVALAAKILARKPDSKVIYSSGYAADAAVTKYSIPKGSSFLQKPFLPEVLWKMVEARLNA